MPSIWTTGNWTSPLLDASLMHFVAGTDLRWGRLYWDEENTSDETKAYVRVDILSDADVVLVADISRNLNGVDLSQYTAIHPTSTAYIDIKLRFKLFSLTEKPIVKNIRIKTKQEW